MSKNGKSSTNWFGIIFGVIWLLMAVLIFVLYQTGNLGASFKIPRVLSFFYNILGVLWGSVVQFIFSIGVIITSLPKKNK